jgi:hypothetical protein
LTESSAWISKKKWLVILPKTLGIPSGNQTWIAGKTLTYFDDFPSYKPRFIGDFAASHVGLPEAKWFRNPMVDF